MKVAEVVGTNVRRLRMERGWSQKDLALRLDEYGSNWSRAAVGMLESKGVRGERIVDVAALCASFEVPVSELLANIQANPAAAEPSTAWVLTALLGEIHAPESAATSPEKLVQGVAKHDREEANRLARSFQMDLSRLQEIVEDLSGQQSPTVLRDHLANIQPSMTREQARVERARGTRELKALMRKYRAVERRSRARYAATLREYERAVAAAEKQLELEGSDGDD